MTIFALDVSRFLNFIKVCFTRRSRRSARATIEGLNDRGLQDIGLEPYRHEYDTVKPFWMP
jgi:uncharacterized protein YjiS (DUF1127 family)